MIAVDAMGGDFAPRVAVEGAVDAARSGVSVCLFGKADLLESLLYAHDAAWERLPITIEHCSQEVGMDEEPSRTVLHKKDASLVRAMYAVARGEATAFFSVGNSGAILVAATLILGRVEGVLRPAIGDFLPAKKGTVFCMDLGANTDVKSEYLEQFALMGHLYVSLIKGIAQPRVALLSNGHEPYKGSKVVKAAYKRLEQSVGINFVGNVESRDMLDGSIDVLICDGFVGNILLKGVQGTARTIMYWLKRDLTATWLRKLGTLLSRGGFTAVKNRLDYAKRGGALLLGVKQPVIIGHGCSNAQAISHGIQCAQSVVDQHIIPSFAAELTRLIHQQHNPGVVRALRSIFKGKRPTS